MGAGDISGRCVIYLVYHPVSDIRQASDCPEPPFLQRDRVTVPLVSLFHWLDSALFRST